jgi:hypothetical protein
MEADRGSAETQQERLIVSAMLIEFRHSAESARASSPPSQSIPSTFLRPSPIRVTMLHLCTVSVVDPLLRREYFRFR